jgi:hypothetical protein
MASELGPACVKPSVYVGIPNAADDRMAGITGNPMAKGTTTITARASDNSDGTLTPKLNAANEAAQRSGSVYMPTKTQD